jgi:predicted peptidase
MISDVLPPSDMTNRSSARLRAVTNASGYDYLLSLPDNYAPRGRTRWPLLLFLHGAAQRGSDPRTLTEQGLTRLLADSRELSAGEKAAAAKLSSSFIVLAPQCPHFEVWEDEALLALLDDVGTTFKVDAARVYLTGLSMGAFGVWSLGVRQPQRFAALVPICGGGRLVDITAAERNRKAALQELGVWAFHGAKDRVVPLEESERMIAALQRFGARDVRLTVYPDVEHDAWTRAYAEAELYAWLLAHAR